MISVSPTCPNELMIGESGQVRANEINPGAIPLYEWDVDPTDAGRFENPALNETTFQALAEGSARLRLRAADGIYQVTAYCDVRISGAAAFAVSLTASPAAPETGQMVTLTCESVGTTELTELAINQTLGPRIQLTEVSEGVVTLTPLITGMPVFQCIGTSAGGEMSAPSTLTLTVVAGDDGNDNDNDNGNDNGNDNDNGNGGGRR